MAHWVQRIIPVSFSGLAHPTPLMNCPLEIEAHHPPDLPPSVQPGKASTGTFTDRIRHHSRRGFTILEVGIASMIMAMGISTSILVIQRGFAMLDTARNITTAGQIMTSQMEQYRMLDWATVSAYPETATTLSLDSIFSGSSTVATRFALTRSVATPATDIRQITLTITWAGYDGRSISRSMTTYYARYGLHDYIYNGS